MDVVKCKKRLENAISCGTVFYEELESLAPFLDFMMRVRINNGLGEPKNRKQKRVFEKAIESKSKEFKKEFMVSLQPLKRLVSSFDDCSFIDPLDKKTNSLYEYLEKE